jgi:hypothetical protein
MLIEPEEPMPNPLTWYFHWLPAFVHCPGVVINHIVEIGVPFLYCAPQPFAAAAGLVTLASQLILIVSGNLSWLNWLTIVLAIATIDDRPSCSLSPARRVDGRLEFRLQPRAAAQAGHAADAPRPDPVWC